MLAIPNAVAQSLRWTYRQLTGPDGQFERVVVDRVRLSVAIDDGTLREALQVLRRALKPGGADSIVAMAKLRAVARQRESEDEALADAVYAEAMMRYPADVVARACHGLGETSPFWPSLPELLQACEAERAPLLAVAAAIEKVLHPLRLAPDTAQDEAEQCRALISKHRGLGNDVRAAPFEIRLAGIEGRPVASWAEDSRHQAAVTREERSGSLPGNDMVAAARERRARIAGESQ